MIVLTRVEAEEEKGDKEKRRGWGKVLLWVMLGQEEFFDLLHLTGFMKQVRMYFVCENSSF